MTIPAMAQIDLNGTAAGTDRPLQLAPNSPFRDPALKTGLFGLTQ